MLFGRSVFQSILTRLDHEQPEEPVPPGEPAFRVSGLPAGFVAPIEAGESPINAGAAYRAFMADIAAGEPGDTAEASVAGASGPAPSDPDPAAASKPAVPPSVDVSQDRSEPAMPLRFQRLSETEVAQDLALRPEDSLDALAEKRRRFAMDNHPDRVHPLHRERATVRMTIANMLVDRAQHSATTSAFFGRQSGGQR